MSLAIWLPFLGNTNNQGTYNAIASGTISYGSGKLGSLAIQNGTVYIPASEAVQIFSVTKGYSIAFWVWKDSNSGCEMLFGNGDTRATPANRKLALHCYSSNTATYPHRNSLHSWGVMKDDSTSTNDSWTYNGVLPDNTWTHVCVVLDPKTSKQYIYINGQLNNRIVNTSLTGTFTFNYNMPLFTLSSTTKLQDYRIYDHPLSQTEVSRLAEGLILDYSFDNDDFEKCHNFNTADWTSYTNYWTISSQTKNEIKLVKNTSESSSTVAIQNENVRRYIRPGVTITVSGYLYKGDVPYKFAQSYLTPYDSTTNLSWTSRDDGFFSFTLQFGNIESVWIIHTPLFGECSNGQVCYIRNMQWEYNNHATPYCDTFRDYEATTNLIKKFNPNLDVYAAGTDLGNLNFNNQANASTYNLQDKLGYRCIHVMFAGSNNRIFFYEGMAADTYTISFDYYSSTAKSSAMHVERNGGNYTWVGDDVDYTTAGSWQRLSLTITNTSDTTGYFFIQGNTNQEVWVKNIQLERKNHATMFTATDRPGDYIIDNSGFANHAILTDEFSTLSLRETSAVGNKSLYKTSWYLDTIQVSNFNPSFITNGTLCVWYKKAVAGSNFLMASGQSTSYYLDANNSTGAWDGNTGGTKTYYIDGEVRGVAYYDNNWHFYCETGFSLSSWTSLYFNRHDNTWKYDGYIGSIQLYTTTLSADRIKQLYQSKMQIDRSGNLHGKFDEGSAKLQFNKTSIIDASTFNEIYQHTDGSLWLPISVHNNHSSTNLFPSSGDYTKPVFKNDECYINLGLLTSADHGTDWEFLVMQQAAENGPFDTYRFKQTVNPMTATWTDVKPGSANVTLTPGSSYGGTYFMNTANARMCFANSNNGNWFGWGIGNTYNGGIPSICNTTVKGYQIVYLRIYSTNLRLEKTNQIIANEIKEI